MLIIGHTHVSHTFAFFTHKYFAVGNISNVNMHVLCFIHEQRKSTNVTRRREKVGALYSTVFGLLAIIAEHTLNFSLLCHRIYSPGGSVVIVVLN